MTRKTVYIDGEAGTTGLQVRSRLANRHDIELILLEERRKDVEARRESLNQADLVILCLPDVEAKQAVSMIDNPHTKVIDASTAHRVAEGWVYGLVEYDHDHPQKIATAKRVSNPGCYASAAIALLYPLIKSGLLPSNWPVSIAAVSGYSGGGKTMISAFEREDEPEQFQLYGLSLTHKHLPEITKWSGLEHPPIFMPSIAPYVQGMAVSIPLPLWTLGIKPAAIHTAYQQHYPVDGQVKIHSPEATNQLTRLYPQHAKGQDHLSIHVFHSEDQQRALVMAVLDNLGKGASGQAVQSLNLMLGLDVRAAA